MARKFNEYRVVDGRTKFAASDMNPRFESIDQRLHAQEVIEKDWRGAIYEITTFGLRRIDEFIGPAKDDLDAKLVEATDALADVDAMLVAKRDEADVVIASMQAELNDLADYQFDISQITGLQSALNAKLVKTNDLSDVASAPTALRNIGGLAFTWTTKTAAYTAVAGDRILADTSGGIFTVTLPSAPASGDEVWFADPGANWATNNLTVSGNGNNIDGAASFTADVNEGHFIATYNGTAWVVRFTGGSA